MIETGSEEENRLKKAFRDGFNLSDIGHVEEMEFSKSKEWDSIAHLLLIASIEKEFNIVMTTKDLLALSSFPVAKEIVAKYLKTSE